MKKRTISVILSDVIVRHDDWESQAFIRKFGELPERKQFQLLTQIDLKPNQHLMHLSNNWTEAISKGVFENSEDLAEQIGLSGGRVRQILRFQKLSEEIQKVLLSTELPKPSIKKLIRASSMSILEQHHLLKVEV